MSPAHPRFHSLPGLAALLLALLVFLLPGAALSATSQVPAFQGDVLDETGLFAEAERQALLERIRVLREDSGIWAAVYVTRGLGDESIEAVALATFEMWKLGLAGKDNGLLVLIAPTERRMRIEVGYGLEGFITDALSKRIIDEIYQPAFRQGKYAEGVLQGFEVMAMAARGETLPPTSAESAVDFDGGRFLRLYLATLALNLLPPCLYLLARTYGHARGRMGSEDISVKGQFILAAFFGLFFGLFFAMFGQDSEQEPGVLAILIGMNVLFASVFALPAAAQARRYLSAAAYRRWRARQRLLRMRRRSREKRPIFGVWFDPTQVTASQGGAMPEPRSSSSSSSSDSGSSSSSSGGGSSGGGGASGSW